MAIQRQKYLAHGLGLSDLGEESDFELTVLKAEKPYTSNNALEDRVLTTTVSISPYANTLVQYIRQMHDNSDARVILGVTSAGIQKFVVDFNKYYNIMKLLTHTSILMNALDPENEMVIGNDIDVYSDKKKVHIHAMIMSSTKSLIEQYAQEFHATSSSLIEYLIYAYLYNLDSDDNFLVGIKAICNDKMCDFETAISVRLDSLRGFNNIDDTNAKIMCIKQNASDVKKSSHYYDLPDGNRYVVRIERTSKYKR